MATDTLHILEIANNQETADDRLFNCAVHGLAKKEMITESLG